MICKSCTSEICKICGSISRPSEIGQPCPYTLLANTSKSPKKNTIWLFNVAMERSTIFKFGKPSISMGHLYHSYVSHNQRVWHWWALKILQLQVLVSPCFITTVQIMWGPGYPHHTVTEPLIFPRDNQVFLQHKNGYHMILHKSHGLQKKQCEYVRRENQEDGKKHDEKLNICTLWFHHTWLAGKFPKLVMLVR